MAAVAAGLVVGLAACGQGAGTTDGDTALPSASPSTTAPSTPTPSPSVTAPSPTPSTTAPSPTATPTIPSTKPTPKPKPSATHTTKPKPTPTPSASITPKPKPSPKASATETAPARTDLRRGDKGPDVLRLQQRLSDLGYWLGEPNGSFGPLTQQAVWAFQKSAGLSRDGAVGPKTQAALEKGIRPSTRLSGNGIDINLSRQILMVVRDGQVKYILNTSTGGGYEYEARDGGKAIATTPKGTFKVYYTVDGLDHGRLGDMWRPRYFHGGYAVHGSPSIPPYPASHGCARVSNAAMDMIWSSNYMPKGGTVLVR